MADRLLRDKEVMNRTGLKRSALYKLQNLGRFPRSVKLAGTRAMAFSEIAVNEWIEAQLKPATPAPVANAWVTGPLAVSEAGDIRRG
jgi:prophage regulatory protein